MPTTELASPTGSVGTHDLLFYGRRGRPSAWRVGALGALVKLATALPVLTRYGWDRDELYFLQAGHHLALGYVDFPMVTALVTRLTYDLAGPTLFALRLTGVVSAMGVIILLAFSVAELGGGTRAQIVAVGAFVGSPWGLGLGMLLHPTMFDALTEAAFGYLALRILLRPEPRLWPALGLVAGIGLETKGTIAVLLAGFLAGAVLFERDRLRDRRVLLALAIAVAAWLPQIGWEIARGWPTLTFLPTQDAVTAASASRPAYLLQQVLFLGASLPLAALGSRMLWRHAPLRALALAAPLVDLLFWLERGRCYYALPTIIVPLAAGAVTADQRWTTASRRSRTAILATLTVLQTASLGLGAVVVWPVLPTQTMISLGVWKPSFYDDEIGWHDLVTDTARAWRTIPPSERAGTVILAANYGEAGALDLWGPRAGLPTALSGHLSFQYWHPQRMPQHTLLTVGYSRYRLAHLCAHSEILGRVTNRWHLNNQEEHQPIALCRLSRPLAQIWSRQIATDHL